MRIMGLEAIYPKPHTTQRHADTRFTRICCGIWRSRGRIRYGARDITYIRCGGVHVPDGDHRLVQPLRVGMAFVEHAGGQFLRRGVGGGLARRQPEIFNTDQGAQFTSRAFTGRLESWGVAISMDGRGRALDNVFVERLWRSVKYEWIYLNDFATVCSQEQGLTNTSASSANSDPPSPALSDAGRGLPSGEEVALKKNQQVV